MLKEGREEERGKNRGGQGKNAEGGERHRTEEMLIEAERGKRQNRGGREKCYERERGGERQNR